MFTALKEMLGFRTADLRKLRAQQPVILDVRTDTEFTRWHIDGAVHIPFNRLTKAVRQVRQLNRPVITCCDQGRRSGLAALILKGLGIEAYNGGDCRQLNRKWYRPSH